MMGTICSFPVYVCAGVPPRTVFMVDQRLDLYPETLPLKEQEEQKQVIRHCAMLKNVGV